MAIVTLQRHADTHLGAAWRATVQVPQCADRENTPTPHDEYGGYGSTPLDAVEGLAKSLANVLGYERAERTREVVR